MSYIELHEHVWSHPKTVELSRILGISKTYSVAHLARLWTWCLRYADTGNISTFSSFQIADAADWPGDADIFIDALSKAGYVDDKEDGVYIHDWDDYVGRLLRLRAIDKERKRTERETNKMSSGHPSDVPPTTNGCPSVSSGIAYPPIAYPPIANTKDKGNKFPPTLEEVEKFCLDEKYNMVPSKWYDYYLSNGWMVGKTRMKDWKAAVRNWERRETGHLPTPETVFVKPKMIEVWAREEEPKPVEPELPF